MSFGDGFLIGMMDMKTLTLDELTAHDVLEFCYAENYPNHWNSNSIFVEFDEFTVIYPNLEKVIPDFKLYAPQMVTLDEWSRIKAVLWGNEEYASFTEAIDMWIANSPFPSDYFWILGV